MITKFVDKCPGQEVRALSWKQPFATMMLHEKYETRTWPTKYRGWVLICASAKGYSPYSLNEISYHWSTYRKKMNQILATYEELPLGRAIAIGKLVDCYPMENTHAHTMRSFVNYQPGLWIHEYDHVWPIVQFGWKGKLGWSTLDEETKDKILLL
jgi:hypothetical protein